MKKTSVIVVAGPTASGKTRMAVRLAKTLGGEVISADSMQIYRHLDVGTAKPTKEEMEEVPHHMIDICDINESFSVVDFCALAKEKIIEIKERGNVPIISGGTGLYIDSLVKGTKYSGAAENKELREELEALARKEGKDAVYSILKDLDIDAANSIHPNNLKRVIRAIEIVKSEGKPLKECVVPPPEDSEEYDVSYIVLTMERRKLYDKIDKRVDEMVTHGIYDEAVWLFENVNSYDSTSMQAIGYKEFLPVYEGTETMEEAIEKLKRDTRRYAKRQMTWFRGKKDAMYLDVSKEDAMEKALDFIKGAVK